MQTIRAFDPVVANTNNIAVTAASQIVAIPHSGVGTQSVRLVNSGTQVVFFTFGTSGSTASLTTSIPILANTEKVFTVHSDFTHIAVIAGATGSTLYVTAGTSI